MDLPISQNESPNDPDSTREPGSAPSEHPYRVLPLPALREPLGAGCWLDSFLLAASLSPGDLGKEKAGRTASKLKLENETGNQSLTSHRVPGSLFHKESSQGRKRHAQ